MFNGMFNDGNYEGNGNGNCGGGCGGGMTFGGCNCTWILLIILFLCCGGKLRNFSLNVNPCCLILLTALLFCTGGISVGNGCK